MIGKKKDLNLGENREIFDGFVVISNEINHLMSMLSQLLRIHGPQPTSFPVQFQLQSHIYIYI